MQRVDIGNVLKRCGICNITSRRLQLPFYRYPVAHFVFTFLQVPVPRKINYQCVLPGYMGFVSIQPGYDTFTAGLAVCEQTDVFILITKFFFKNSSDCLYVPLCIAQLRPVLVIIYGDPEEILNASASAGIRAKPTYQTTRPAGSRFR